MRHNDTYIDTFLCCIYISHVIMAHTLPDIMYYTMLYLHTICYNDTFVCMDLCSIYRPHITIYDDSHTWILCYKYISYVTMTHHNLCTLYLHTTCYNGTFVHIDLCYNYIHS